MYPTLSFEHAWAGYRRWEHRMPAAAAPLTTRRIAGLAEIIDRFDAIILDNFGVLSLGGPAIPQGAGGLAAIRERNLPLRILTNDGAKGIEAMLAGHTGRGYHFEATEIIPGYRLLERALNDHQLDRPWGVIGLSPLPEAHLTGAMRSLTRGGIAEVGRVGGVVFLDTGDWTETDQETLVDAFQREPRPIVVCNPDLTAPYPDTLSAEPGWYAHHLADATGIEPLFLGKPYPEIYDLALAGLGHIPRQRILAVGDTPHTDVLGAHAAGIQSLLVETGFTRGRDAEALIAESGLHPNYIAAAI